MDSQSQDKNLLLAIIEGTNDYIFVKDLEGRYILMNSPAARLLRRRVDEVLGKNDFDLFLPEMASKLRNDDQKVLNAGQPVTYEEVIHPPDGTPLVMITTKAPYRDQNGKIVGVLGISRDITTRKMAEERLRAEHAYRKPIEEAMLAGVAAVDLEGKIIYVNPAFCKMVGWEEIELLGLKPPHPFWPLEDSIRINKVFQKRISTGSNLSPIEYLFQHRKGNRFYVLVLTSPLTDGHGNKIGVVSTFTDITDRKEAEETIRQSEEKLRQITETIQEVFWITEINGSIIYVSPSFEKVWGVSSKELFKNSDRYWETIYPEDHNKVQDFFKKQKDKECIEEYRIIRPDGMIRWIRDSAFPIRDSEGNIYRVAGVATDITEQKLGEIKLQDSYNLVRSIVEGTTDSVYVRDLNGHYLMINSTAANFLGKSAEKLIGETTAGSISPETIQKFREDDQKVLESGKTDTFEVKMTVNGKDQTFLTTKGPVRDHQGNIFGIFGISRDITDRKMAEDKLKTEYAFRKAIEESLTSGICAADIHGKIIYVNPAFSKMVGWNEEELLGTMIPHSFWPPEETDKIMNAFKSRLNKSGPPGSNELVFRRKNEERFSVLVLSSPLQDGNGNMIGILGSFIDISEKKKMEEELSKVEKLKSLGLLAGGIAHDFNNILTAILGNLSLAMLELDPNITASRYLKETEQASLKAKNLASQLLTFTKGGAPQKKIISITQLIKDSTTFALRGSNVSPEFRFPDNLWAIEVDPGQITQVIYNLAINAQQAMIEGGRIVISADNVMIDETSAKNLLLNPGPFVKISFKDNGVGIPQDLFNKIFDPFFTTKEMGSGLGLFSAYSIVKNHNGAIKVESKVEMGTNILVYLPAVIDKKVKDEKKSEAIISGSGKILLMDDDESVRKMAGAMIQTLGYNVEVATKGEEVLKMYRTAKERNQPFQAVILDLTVPGGKGGRQTIQELLAYDPNVKAIVSSGYSTDPILANYREYKFKGCVAKPYRIQELSKTLNDILKKE